MPSHNTLTLLHILTYGAELFLRSCQLRSHSRTSQHLMEFEGSFPCSQEPSTGPYPEPDRSNIHFLLLRSFVQGICPGPRLLMNFRNKLIFYGEELLAPRPTPKLEYHPLSAVRNCLFNTYEATFHICSPSPPSCCT
jgi:hypothetical protein